MDFSTAGTCLVTCSHCGKFYDVKMSHDHHCEGKIQAMKDQFKSLIKSHPDKVEK